MNLRRAGSASFTALVVGAIVIGCSNDRAEVSFSFVAPTQSPVSVDMVQVDVSWDGKVRYRLDADDFSEGEGSPRTKRFRTPKSGLMEIEVALVNPPADTAAHGVISLSLRSDWRYSVDLFIAPYDPLEGCFGCIGSEAFPLEEAWQTEEIDSLVVVWGGNSISNPVIY